MMSFKSKNKGQFVELCELFSKFDLFFKVKFNNYFNLTSHKILNELVEIFGQLVLKQFYEKIISIGYDSIQADEARFHHIALLTVSIRFV